uniref:RRM domain-containing protein n=1 Tax=Strigamia maritima TaxID=126957 RepID=T1JBL4_STRMM
MGTTETACCRFNIGGYRVLPVKFSEQFATCRAMYFKQHLVRDPHPLKPVDQTLIVLNVPPYCNEQCLKRIFSIVGQVKSIYFHEKPTSGVNEETNSNFFESHTIQGYKVAYVVFDQPKSVKKALKMKFKTPCMLSTKDEPLTVGVEKWSIEYANSFPKIDKLQAEIDEFMKDYETTIQKEKEIEKKKADEPDDEGWVTVSSRGKKKGFARTETNVEKINKKETKKRGQRELLNFYTFQIRDAKRDHIAELMKNFEEDKKKIALLRASRKFKPY